jgi:flavin-dependent dehydrogenase
VSREALDSALAREAVASGADFLDGVTARLCDESCDERIVELSSDGSTVNIVARVVVAADGLRGSLLEGRPEFRRIAALDSLIGIGTTLATLPPDYRPGTIYMAVAEGGYVGQVGLQDGRFDVAAAVDRRHLANSGGPAPAAQRIVEAAGLTWPEELSPLKWHGTPPLTRRLAHVAGRRLFVIGDAGAYIEPFTGEGMTWAMLSALAVAPLVCAGANLHSPHLATRWEAIHRRLLGRQMRFCRGVSRLLRSPLLTRAAIMTLKQLPWLATPLVHYVAAPRSVYSSALMSNAETVAVI